MVFVWDRFVLLYPVVRACKEGKLGGEIRIQTFVCYLVCRYMCAIVSWGRDGTGLGTSSDLDSNLDLEVLLYACADCRSCARFGVVGC